MIAPMVRESLVPPPTRLDFLGDELLTMDCMLGLRVTATGDVGSAWRGWSPLVQTVNGAVCGEARVLASTGEDDEGTGSIIFLGGEEGAVVVGEEVSMEMGGRILEFDFLFSPFVSGTAGVARESFRAVG